MELIGNTCDFTVALNKTNNSREIIGKYPCQYGYNYYMQGASIITEVIFIKVFISHYQIYKIILFQRQ